MWALTSLLLVVSYNVLCFNLLGFDTSFFFPDITEDKDKPFYHYMQTCFYYLVLCFSCLTGAPNSQKRFRKILWLVVSENTKAMLEQSVQQDWESSQTHWIWYNALSLYNVITLQVIICLFPTLFRYILQIHVADWVFTSLIFFAVFRSWL